MSRRYSFSADATIAVTAKERVLTAAARGQPDRVPLDFSADAFVLQVDAPTANILALYDTGFACRRY